MSSLLIVTGPPGAGKSTVAEHVAAVRAGLGPIAIDYAVLLPSIDVCIERVTARSEQGIVDADATRTMHRAFTEAQIDLRHRFDSADLSPVQLAAEIATRRASGSLRRDA